MARFKSYMPVHTREQLTGLVEKVLKSRVVKIQRKDLGEINAIYFVILENELECVVRVSPKEREYNSFSQEAWALRKCKETGVPTPEILAMDTNPTDFPEPYMITKRIKGRPGAKSFLSDTRKLGVIHELGHYLSLIHSVKVEGFGTLIKHNSDFVGRHKTLWKDLSYRLRFDWWVKRVLEAKLITIGELQEIRSNFNKNKNLFNIKRASLVYGDVSLKNVIINGGKIVGVLDMENVIASDPIWDFCWFHFFAGKDENAFNALKKGYDNKTLFDENFMRKMYFYELLLALSLLSYHDSRKNRDALKFVLDKISKIKRLLKLNLK